MRGAASSGRQAGLGARGAGAGEIEPRGAGVGGVRWTGSHEASGPRDGGVQHMASSGDMRWDCGRRHAREQVKLR